MPVVRVADCELVFIRSNSASSASLKSSVAVAESKSLAAVQKRVQTCMIRR